MAILIEMAKFISAATDENGSSVGAVPNSCAHTVVEQRASGAGVTEAARNL